MCAELINMNMLIRVYMFADWCWACCLHCLSGICQQWNCLMVTSLFISTFCYLSAQQYTRFQRNFAALSSHCNICHYAAV